MSASSSDTTPPIVPGAIAGVFAWLVGYVFTYALTGTDLRESGLNAIIEFTGGESAAYELVGWVFFNAHFVDVVYTGIPIRNPPASFVGGEEGFTVLLFLVPPALLFAAGLGLGRYYGVTGPNRGAITGVLVVPGYLVLSVFGAFLFRVSALGATGEPEFLTAILLAGIIYPLVFGGLGGAVAGMTAARGGESRLSVES
ncbi:MAG: hypothetical protein ACLFNI_08580 [Natronomonas sp.]